MTTPKLVVCDTMNLWIDISQPMLLETLKEVDILILNDAEARQLTGEDNLTGAGKKILTFGPTRVIIKKGEHGAISLTESTFFAAPAYPLTNVVDPTGAGDSFAGGFMGSLATLNSFSEQSIRRSIINGTVIASFNVEDFSLDRQRTLTPQEIGERFHELEEIVRKIETGEINLDEAIKAYERGSALKKHCDSKLKEAQEKVSKIKLDSDGSPTLENMNTG